MVKKLKTEYVAAALASLGHEARLSVYRLLVRAGHDGLTVGEVSEQLGLPASTLAHHLKMLVHAGLVKQEKRGREVFNKPDFDAMSKITAFFEEHCCAGVSKKSGAA